VTAISGGWQWSDSMELIEMLRNIIVREGFEAGRSIQEISEETGLSVPVVLRREMDLHLIPTDDEPARTKPSSTMRGQMPEQRTMQPR
jgi:hypothetical protein